MMLAPSTAATPTCLRCIVPVMQQGYISLPLYQYKNLGRCTDFLPAVMAAPRASSTQDNGWKSSCRKRWNKASFVKKNVHSVMVRRARRHPSNIPGCATGSTVVHDANAKCGIKKVNSYDILRWRCQKHQPVAASHPCYTFSGSRRKCHFDPIPA